jgi:hypothetical protein
VKPETFIVTTSCKLSATVEASCGAANPVHPRKIALTVHASVNEAATQSAPNQRQCMTGVLAWDPKITTRFPPFGPVRQNPSARAEMCQQMRQLMAQRSIDFSGAKFLQRRIKQNERVLEICTTDGSAHAIVPVHPHTCGQIFYLQGAQKIDSAILQSVARRQLKDFRRFEAELELTKR